MADVEADRSDWEKVVEAASSARQESDKLGSVNLDTPGIQHVLEKSHRCAMRAKVALGDGDGALQLAKDGMHPIFNRMLFEDSKHGQREPCNIPLSEDLTRALLEDNGLSATAALARGNLSMAALASGLGQFMLLEHLDDVDKYAAWAEEGATTAANVGEASSEKGGVQPSGCVPGSTATSSQTVSPEGPAIQQGQADGEGGDPPDRQPTLRPFPLPLLALQQMGMMCKIHGHTETAKYMYQWSRIAFHCPFWAGDPDAECRVIFPPSAFLEVLASTLMGLAQVAMDKGDLEDASRIARDAYKAAEGVSGAEHPRITPVLLLMATIEARSGKESSAETIYRRAAQLINLRTTADLSCTPHQGMHMSIAALLSCRYAQLLAGLPNREREMLDWRARGIALIEACRGEGTGMEQVFGSMDALQPGGCKGEPVVMDVFYRRAFFCPLESEE